MSVERIRPGTYRVRWREAGKQRSKLVGSQEAAKRFEQKNRERLLLGESNFWDKGTQSFEQFASEWFARKGPNLKPSTRLLYATLIDDYLLPDLRSVPLRAIDVARLEALRDRHASHAPVRTAKALTLLGQILKNAQARGEIQQNAALLVERPSQARQREIVVMTPETIEAIRSWMLRTRGKGGARGQFRFYGHRDATLVSLLAYVGLRPGEVIGTQHDPDSGLRWGSLQERSLRVYAPKTNKHRAVRILSPLSQDLAEWRLVAGRPNDRAMIVPNEDGGPWSRKGWANWVQRVWRPACIAVGLDPRPRPYDLRHSWVSLMIASGMNELEVAMQAGHSPTMTRDTYGHLFDSWEPGERISAEERIRQARDKREAVEA